MVTMDDFRVTIEKIFEIAKQVKLSAVVIQSGNLHRLVGGYPGSNHRMPMCCNAMRQMMKENDEILKEPPKGNGASLEIIYWL
jgi:hypothetical protein